MSESQCLDQFITDESLRLAAFVMWWRQQHAINPQAFPLQLEPGLWDEALETFDPQQLETREHGNNADCFRAARCRVIRPEHRDAPGAPRNWLPNP